MEEIHQLPEFSMYGVSNLGNVVSFNYDPPKILKPSYNQQGIANVTLSLNGVYRRSIARLVAEEFLPPPDRVSAEDNATPIHLNGDLADCRADNLMWRPRWFAIRYHRQFRTLPEWWLNSRIEIVQTGEVFDHVIDCCMIHGLLVEQVVMQAHNPPGCHYASFSRLDFKIPRM